MKKTWWKESVVYQIYPRSFQDSNGDGIGDIPGIISRLDYLQKLGVDVIWLCPVYESPNDDNGYDISNYRGIMDEFGTIEDWERLLDGLHSRGMKLIMDLVVNHTSDEHAWFVESRKSKDNPYRDYYIWRDGKDSKEGKEPNNWSSIFSGSAWKYDEATEQYYLHLFSKKQPDLNWENEKVRREVYDLMTWWLDKGIDGFRMDVINMISKVEGLPDGEGEGKYKDGSKYFMNGPRIHEFLQEMNREVLSKYDVMTVGETPGVSPEEAALYVGEDRGELSMVFQFESMDIDSGPGGKWFVTPWKLLDFKRIMSKWQTELEGKGWNSLFLNNHDQPRMVSRFGDDGKYRKQSAKMLGTLLHTMQGTPFIYQGEELGMTNVKFATIEEYQDIETHNMFNEHREAGRAVEEIMASIYSKGRDNARTPMQWDATAHGGFTTGTPWLVVNPNYQEINAGEAMADPDSIFHYYRRLIELRKQHEVIVYGKYQLLLEDHEHIYAYTRTWGDERLLVILNFFADPVTFELPASVGYQSYERLIGNYEWSEGTRLEQMELRPYEAQVLRLS
ncbi:glucohydrolase [Paenibacillus sp. 79R4]|uniref:glycoside hydrolase family 13 protein n=1 Tax=Paenibacillus sp. 79R4 TaxID=2212847 RepID=UPI0015BE5E34|nr:alpha-glucosidase [Paenibacillus sp. 79R4]NWL89239.1 glucohydrolase [Paenibacillus sp. 79R4]